MPARGSDRVSLRTLTRFARLRCRHGHTDCADGYRRSHVPGPRGTGRGDHAAGVGRRPADGVRAPPRRLHGAPRRRPGGSGEQHVGPHDRVRARHGPGARPGHPDTARRDDGGHARRDPEPHDLHGRSGARPRPAGLAGSQAAAQGGAAGQLAFGAPADARGGAGPFRRAGGADDGGQGPAEPRDPRRHDQKTGSDPLGAGQLQPPRGGPAHPPHGPALAAVALGPADAYGPARAVAAVRGRPGRGPQGPRPRSRTGRPVRHPTRVGAHGGDAGAARPRPRARLRRGHHGRAGPPGPNRGAADPGGGGGQVSEGRGRRGRTRRACPCTRT
ncbi:hypothetical protein QF026_006139 [Streptomyces aurantiacus]|nr:hypothetical protein [Streptomyces aurantiacus]